MTQRPPKDLLSLLDRRYVYRCVNQAYLELHAKSRDEVIGHSAKELYGTEKFNNLLKRNLDACLAGEPVSHETWVELDDDRKRLYEVNYHPFLDADGEIEFIGIYSRDITERHLREEHYRLLFESAPDAMLLVAEDGRITLHNQQTEIVLGYTKEELAGMQVEELVPERLREQHRADRQIYLQSPMTRPMGSGRDLTVQHKAGHEIPVEISLSPMTGAEGILTVCTLRDIRERLRLASERDEAEDHARDSENKFRLLYDNTPAMFFTLAPGGAILSINRHGLSVLGYSEDEILGLNIFNITHRNDRKKAKRLLKRLIDKPDDIHRWELRKLKKNGDVIFGRCTVRLTRDIAGNEIILAVCEDITEQKRLSEQLEYQASHDELTGFINRSALMAKLNALIEQSRRQQSEHTLCYMDLDQFKVVNDTCGHAAGDELLRQFAALLKMRIRAGDSIARVGGDEFVLLMEHCQVTQAKRITQQLRELIRSFRFTWEDRQFSIGISMGVVPINKDTESGTTVLRQADAACYAAKDSGRDRIVVYEESDQELSRRHGEMEWVSRINHAIDEDRFFLVSQPILPLDGQTPATERCEILLRLRDEHGQTVTPSVFLGPAERYNLSTRIDRWVMNNILTWMNDNRRDIPGRYQFSINLSSQTLCDPDMLHHITDLLEKFSTPPECICFEITETSAISNLTEALRFIKFLGGIGCRFALDDFGSGFSSFDYLRNLPVDYLKIDGKFVRNMVRNPIDHAMVKSINDIGHVMGVKTVAEFVENDEIVEKLREVGVDFAQGYALGRPAPLTASE